MDTVKGKPDWDTKTGTSANNQPVGAAGQPVNNFVKNSNKSQSKSDSRMSAIERRMAKAKKSK